MGLLTIVPWALSGLLLLVCISFCLLVWTGTLKLHWTQRVEALSQPYPRPGRLEGTTAFFDQETLLARAPKKANKSYPTWFKGPQDDGRAVPASLYFYQELVGPDVETGLKAHGLSGGLLAQKAGTTYPSHNHPAAEIYYILEGEATWTVDDEQDRRVGPGSIIFHRPYAVHGWVTKTDLKAIWIWWEEGERVPEVLTRGARLTNPERDSVQGHAKPFAEPLPEVRKR